MIYTTFMYYDSNITNKTFYKINNGKHNTIIHHHTLFNFGHSIMYWSILAIMYC